MEPAHAADPRIRELEEIFRRLSALLYDTTVSAERLDVEVLPFLDEQVTFLDPWQSESGRDAYRLGMKGFHAMFRFDFEFFQVNVQLNAAGTGGRAIVDGIMHLKQLSWLFTYPLRTILVYDFKLPAPASAKAPLVPRIHRHEEMWSLGDMLAAVPVVGPFYRDRFRKAFSRGFLVASRLACRLQGAS